MKKPKVATINAVIETLESISGKEEPLCIFGSKFLLCPAAAAATNQPVMNEIPITEKCTGQPAKISFIVNLFFFPRRCGLKDNAFICSLHFCRRYVEEYRGEFLKLA
jgi:hypothetical protein